MNGVLKASSLIVLSLSLLTGCSQNFKSETSQLMSSVINSVKNNVNISSRQETENKQDYMAMAANKSDMVYQQNKEYYFSELNILTMDSVVVGGFYDNRWLGHEELTPLIKENYDYKVYCKNQFKSVVSGQTLNGSDRIPFTDDIYSYREAGEEDIIYRFSGENGLNFNAGIHLSVDNEIYKKLLDEYLDKNKLNKGFRITDLIKIDLDNDGQDEVFIEAFHLDDPDELFYLSETVIFMRKIVDGKVVEIPFVLPNAKDLITNMDFCDLNEDGVMEILLSSHAPGYTGYMVYEFKDNQINQILYNEIFY